MDFIGLPDVTAELYDAEGALLESTAGAEPNFALENRTFGMPRTRISTRSCSARRMK